MNNHKVSVLGGCGEQGRSAYLVTLGDTNVLLDYGVKKTFRDGKVGEGPLTELFDASKIDVVILSHAHQDHSAYLPLLYKMGYTGKVYCTAPTVQLSKKLCNGWLKVVESYDKPLPYSREDIELIRFEEIGYYEKMESHNVTFELRPSGHLLGGAMIVLESKDTRVVFSGDVSFDNQALPEPASFEKPDLFIVDSTHGTQEIPRKQEEAQVLNLLQEGLEEKKGYVLVPIASMGRFQELLMLLSKQGFKHPIVLDNSFKQAWLTYDQFAEWTVPNWITWEELTKKMDIRMVNTDEERNQFFEEQVPGLILAGNPMLSDGKVLSYLPTIIEDERNTIILNGYLGDNTLGQQLKAGAQHFQLNGSDFEVQAKIVHMAYKNHPDGKDLAHLLSQTSAETTIILAHSDHQVAVECAEHFREQYPHIHAPLPGFTVEF